MLEYLTYKKIKKHRDAKEKSRQETSPNVAASSTPTFLINAGGPVLTDDDERFFERLTSEGGGYTDEAGKRPPLPPRAETVSYTWDSDENTSATTVAAPVKNNMKTSEKDNSNGGNPAMRGLSFLVRHNPLTARKATSSNKNLGLEPTNLAIPLDEEEREKKDLSRVLDDLNLSARNNKTFSLSQDSQALVGQFTVVLKDLVNGVPTAAADLRHLFEDHDGTLARNYEKLPSSMKKLVTNLPDKLTGSLAPELLAVAAESQGLRHDRDAKGGLKEQAMNLVKPKNLGDLVTKPSAIVGMLKAIMNALKTRWPAFIGTNVIWSVALFCK